MSSKSWCYWLQLVIDQVCLVRIGSTTLNYKLEENVCCTHGSVGISTTLMQQHKRLFAKALGTVEPYKVSLQVQQEAKLLHQITVRVHTSATHEKMQCSLHGLAWLHCTCALYLRTAMIILQNVSKNHLSAVASGWKARGFDLTMSWVVGAFPLSLITPSLKRLGCHIMHVYMLSQGKMAWYPYMPYKITSYIMFVVPKGLRT